MSESIILLLRLAGPLQSWGLQSRFSHRDTAQEPTKSGVIGLLCAALGRARTEPVEDLAALEMAVRVDQEGLVACEFQTAGGGAVPLEFNEMHGRRNSTRYGVSRASGGPGDTEISQRYYLSDASFLVALGGDRTLIENICDGLENPVWPLFLGRKGFVPGEPVLELPNPLREEKSPAEVLRTEPWGIRHPWRSVHSGEPPAKLRLMLETNSPGPGWQARNDVPISFEKGKRAFRQRYVRFEFIPTPFNHKSYEESSS